MKKKVSAVKRIEIENQISEDEYLKLLHHADMTKQTVSKTRYCIGVEEKTYEIDIYPFWKDKAIMEIEMRDENEELIFPKFIKIIREVTGEAAYKNSVLAQKQNRL